MTVITRFAPSPTGYLHIGGARTALFNWLFARHHGGKFHLRIEDTDRARSTTDAVDALLQGLKWLGLEWDDEVTYQFARSKRHAEIAHQLVEENKAYYCFATAEELEAMRKQAEAEKRQFKYDRRWRDQPISAHPQNVPPAIRLKAPLTGGITIRDHVQGEVTVDAKELDDMVLLRADGTPTYMLAVVVDDHDMGITHVIRGDDHFTNAFRQSMLYHALGWDAPEFAHIPLIHGEDGAKLSKRHGAVGIEQYEAMGYLPEAMRNYLLRLGWSHGDDEIISTEQAIAWFNLEGLGKSPSRLDMAKLNSVNAHYIKQADPERLARLMVDGGWWMVDREAARTTNHEPRFTEPFQRLINAVPLFVPRTSTLVELADQMTFLIAKRVLDLSETAKEILTEEAMVLLKQLLPSLQALQTWNAGALKEWAKKELDARGLKMKDLMMPLRAALTGRDQSPGVFEIMEILGREECIGRIQDIC